MAAAVTDASLVHCRREHLAFNCIEPFDADHFAAVHIAAQARTSKSHEAQGRQIQATSASIGPGGGGGAYSVITADGRYELHGSELQRLTHGTEPRLPSATRLLKAIAAEYENAH